MKRSSVPILVFSCIVVLACCLCLLVLITSGLISVTNLLGSGDVEPLVGQLPEITPVILAPTPFSSHSEESLDQVVPGTLEMLQNTRIPTNDLVDLAQRFGDVKNIPLASAPVASALQVGDQKEFWLINADTDQNFKIQATLQYVTDHAYFWIEDRVRYREQDLQALAHTFEDQIYPTNRSLFGSEWSPGVDGDPHLYIIYAQGLGNSLAGYYSSSDEYHPLAHEYSNMAESFVLNSDTLDLDEPYTYGVLAHEFQHMIHWYQDRNEATWLNEGISELAVFMNGYNLGGFDYLYINDTDLQLNHWPDESAETTPHYGASFLFVNYLLDRFGTDLIKQLVSHHENGLNSLDLVLAQLGVQDHLTGEGIRADDVFQDWVLTNYLQDDRVFDGRFAYHGYEEALQAVSTETFNTCPFDRADRTVHQYGVDYISFKCRGEYTLRFEGDTDVGVLPVGPYSGDYGFWSNVGDDSDMTLTRNFDFREVSGPLTLVYWTWYDLEEQYDYLYLVASTDGQSWEILTTPSGTGEDPSGNSFGWGYNGLSGGDGRWIQEKVDLSRFSGQQVQIRFEYVTDGAVTGEGFWLDDVAIPEIGYFTDFESGPDGWQPEGFVRIQNQLPQNFRLALIHLGDATQVTYIQLSPDNTIEIPFTISGWHEEVILVVSGTTRYTRQVAPYHFQVLP